MVLLFMMTLTTLHIHIYNINVYSSALQLIFLPCLINLSIFFLFLLFRKKSDLKKKYPRAHGGNVLSSRNNNNVEGHDCVLLVS